jgi:hypothetical protein
LIQNYKKNMSSEKAATLAYKSEHDLVKQTQIQKKN